MSDHSLQRLTCGLLFLVAADVSAGAAPSTIPFRLIDNRVFVPVAVDNHGPFAFLLDTGAPNFTFSVQAMKASGAKASGISQIDGVGEHTQTAYKARVKDLELGGQAWRNLDIEAVSFQSLNDVIGFTAFDGIAGKPLFDRFVADFDFAASTLRLVPPQQYAVPAGAHVLPFTFYDGFIPLVDGEIGGVEGKFIVDLGDRSSLTLFGPFWRAHKLDAAFGKHIDALTGYGIGGPVRSLVVRVPQFDMGGVRVPRIVARLSLQKSGGFADAAIAGSIGTGVLKRFHAAFDYSRLRLVLEDTPATEASDPYDRGGLWIGRHGKKFAVFDVIAGGPAERAGLRVGDVITEVDGVAAEKLDLFQLRRDLSDPAKHEPLHIVALRGGTKIEARLHPEDVLPQN
jgi:hypothetical protein